MTRAQRGSLPSFVRLLEGIVNQIHRLFDWLYHSRYNPLYRAGTFTIGLLFVLLVTGLYLLFFYQVSAPYESVEGIQNGVIGRWVRAVHRYATDLVMVTMVFHVVQILAQGKAWGPRVLAWFSGLILFGAMLLSAWTGYVMIWDRHGQMLAIAGAEILQVFPFLRETLASAFSGGTPILSSFFFMNMFLHVAIPLGMVAGLWIHTARISRTRWRPIRPVFIGSIVALSVLSLFWSAPLLEEADLLFLPGVMKTDLFYGFWLPLWYKGSGFSALLFWLVITLIGCSIPWWWRPRTRESFAPSWVDEDNCLGCRQCSKDCPHEAITMKPRSGKVPLYSSVNPDLCVSCGICIGSCDDLAIGPDGRKGNVQLGEIESKIAGWNREGAEAPLVCCYVCECNGESLEWLEERVRSDSNVDVLKMECCGALSALTVERALEGCDGVFIWGCPERNCQNRDGVELLKERIYEHRHPTLKRRTDRRRVVVAPLAAWEHREAGAELDAFTERLRDLESGSEGQSRGGFTAIYAVRSIVATVILMGVLALLSQWPLGPQHTTGVLRLSFKIPGKAKEECRPLNAAELASLPRHMQKKEICIQKSLDYGLQVSVDGKEVLDRAVGHGGLRADRPLFVNQDIPLIPGGRSFSLKLVPQDSHYRAARTLELARELDVQVGRVYLVDYNDQQQQLYLIENKKDLMSAR